MKNIYVNSQKQLKKTNNFWNHIHFHPTDAIEDFWGQRVLDSLHADKGAKMIRIYAMLEDIVSKNDNNELVYDFTDTDKRLDYLTEKGFIPLICMNFMPRAIAKDESLVSRLERYKKKRICSSMPTEYRLWQDVCEKYFLHLIERYGEETVATWYFHCWNEPNSIPFWMSEAEDWETRTTEYLKLYDFCAQAALPQALTGCTRPSRIPVRPRTSRTRCSICGSSLWPRACPG